VNGILELAQPIGYLVAMVLGILLLETIGWRNIFFLTGALGVLLPGHLLLRARAQARRHRTGARRSFASHTGCASAGKRCPIY